MVFHWQRLNLTVDTSDTVNGDSCWETLSGFAVRRNPKRAHLIVSKVLGKHVAVAPSLAASNAATLADKIVATFAAQETNTDQLCVLGYAETATGLGHNVAAALHAPLYAHSTRDLSSGVTPIISFEEGHSHATHHHVLSRDVILSSDTAFVLVDDELTTGNTAWGTIEEIHHLAPKTHYVIAVLLDMRSEQSRDELARKADNLGVRVDVVSLLSGEVHIPDDVFVRAEETLRLTEPVHPFPVDATTTVNTITSNWEGHTDARHGWTPADEQDAIRSAAATADTVHPQLAGDTVLVIGTEELMYVPQLIAAALPGHVTFQSTTRSPVAAVNADDYAITSAVTFPSLTDADSARYLYNAVNVTATDIVIITANAAAGTATAMVNQIAAANPASATHHVNLTTVASLGETHA